MQHSAHQVLVLCLGLLHLPPPYAMLLKLPSQCLYLWLLFFDLIIKLLILFQNVCPAFGLLELLYLLIKFQDLFLVLLLDLLHPTTSLILELQGNIHKTFLPLMFCFPNLRVIWVESGVQRKIWRVVATVAQLLCITLYLEGYMLFTLIILIGIENSILVTLFWIRIRHHRAILFISKVMGLSPVQLLLLLTELSLGLDPEFLEIC